MQSSFPLYIFYLFLKVVVRISLALFYPRTKISGREHLELNGPTLVCTNHPNTLLDALNAASRVDEQVFFLVNAGMYSKPIFAKLFDALYCIPVQRPQDTNGKPVRNEEAFARCDQHLEAGGHIFIAPEGGSEMEYRLRPIKTGTARIALNAENKERFNLNVRLLPIGFTYGNAPQLGSSLYVNVGEPLVISDYKDLYLQNQRQAVLKITEDLQTRLGSLILNTRDKEEEEMIKRINTILSNPRKLPLDQEFSRNKEIIGSFRQVQIDDPESANALAEKISGYFESLQKAKVNDKAVAGPPQLALRILGILAGLPFFLVGIVANAIPFFIPKLVAKRLNLYIGYEATVKILTALLTFPIFYAIIGWVASYWLSSGNVALLLLCLLPLGYFAWAYAGFFDQTRMFLRWQNWLRKHPVEGNSLKREREEILEGLGTLMASPVVA